MITVILGYLANGLIVTGSLGAIYSGWSWWRQRRRDKQLDKLVDIHLCQQETRRVFKKLDIRPPRRTISRSEVLGLVGMVPTHDGKRFTCAYAATQSFVDQVERVFDGKSDVIEIYFTPCEIRVFELSGQDSFS